MEARRATIRRPRTCREAHLADFESPMLAEGLELFDRVLAIAKKDGEKTSKIISDAHIKAE